MAIRLIPFQANRRDYNGEITPYLYDIWINPRQVAAVLRNTQESPDDDMSYIYMQNGQEWPVVGSIDEVRAKLSAPRMLRRLWEGLKDFLR